MLIKKDDSGSLGQELKKFMTVTHQLDMLVGYFCFSGVKAIVEPLKARSDTRLRVLVGMEVDSLSGQLVEKLTDQGSSDSYDAIKNRFFESVRKIVTSSMADSEAFHERLQLFIELVESGRLEMRKTLNPNHSKLYIFHLDDSQVTITKHIAWITGSSNFSEPGLISRDELNISINDFGQDEVQEYFNELWNDSVPLTDAPEDRKFIIRILKEQSVASSVSPYEAYLMVLKQYLDYQKIKLNEERLNRILKDAGFTRYQYQVDAIAQSLAKLEEYRGVIIADVVGLGKSIIAGALAAMRGRRGLIICPPGLMGDKKGNAGGWYEYKRRFHLHDWEIWSRGKLDDVQEMLKDDQDFDMVIVDEAHNFRNPNTEDYGRLAEICFGKQVVLLTATPFNNRPSDLLALLKLFTPVKSSAFGDLDEQFRFFRDTYNKLSMLNKAIAKGDWEFITPALFHCGISLQIPNITTDIAVARKECNDANDKLAKSLRQIMEKVVIRRNRLDLIDDPDYSEEITTLSNVCNPKEQFFELTEEQDEFYDRVLEEYFGPNGKFHGAAYRPQRYLKNQEGVDESQTNIYYMLLRQLVQRFESSFLSFRKSVENVKKSMETSLQFVERTGFYLYNRKDMTKILETCQDDAEIFSEINRLTEEYERMNEERAIRSRGSYQYNMQDADFDSKRFKDDLVSDIGLMDMILEEVEDLELEKKDPKVKKLVSFVADILKGTHTDVCPEKDSPKRKVLLFSAYSDTIAHVATALEASFPERVLAVDGKNFSSSLSEKVKRNFDASFDDKKQTDDCDILVCTDKLSEGFNLNRAGIVINYDIPWNPTRVIQRVGRINRIGKKVFENLYIFNFFPTKKGSSVVANRAIAENKMFAIHRILGEDAQIFSEQEEPTASELYNKLCSLDSEGDVSFYTLLKKEYAKEKAFLEKNHPEILERIDHFPPMVKTAWRDVQHQKYSKYPSAVFLFRRKGAAFSATVYNKETQELSDWPLDEALRQVKCKFSQKKEAFSPEFWKFPTWDKKKGGPKGIYELLKGFKPQGLTAKGIPDSVQAVTAINRYKAKMDHELCRFAEDVALDIQQYGTIPAYTLNAMAQCGRKSDNVSAVRELTAILEKIRSLRGENYLARQKRYEHQESIIITIEKI